MWLIFYIILGLVFGRGLLKDKFKRIFVFLKEIGRLLLYKDLVFFIEEKI